MGPDLTGYFPWPEERLSGVAEGAIQELTLGACSGTSPLLKEVLFSAASLRLPASKGTRRSRPAQSISVKYIVPQITHSYRKLAMYGSVTYAGQPFLGPFLHLA